MPEGQKKVVDRVFLLLFDAGKAAMILATIAALLLGAAYVWFEGASLTVENRSGYDLAGVTLLTGHPDTGVDHIWQQDLTRGEVEWSYTFTGKDRAVLRYELGGKAFAGECFYESGIAISTYMTINADGSLGCESDMRIWIDDL